MRTGIRRAPSKGCRAWNNRYALFVPAKTPLDTINAINEAVRRTLATPAVSEKLRERRAAFGIKEAYLNEPPEW